MTIPATVHGVAECVSAGDVSAVDVVRATLDRIDSRNERVRAFREVHHDEALEAARRLDQRRDAGHALGPLARVPIGVKDNIVTTAGTSAAGSAMLRRYRSPFDATAIRRLRDADAIIVGRCACDEFAMGSSGEHSAFGLARNPWDHDRVPGGSSSGSAAAVAAGFVPAALGTDTGGSIRQPASFCGIIGFKPTYGRISRSGVVAFGSSLDQIGPMTRSLDDAGLLYTVMAGVDEDDATTSAHHVDDPIEAMQALSDGAPLRIGVDPAHRDHPLEASVSASVDAACERLRDAGATLVEVALPEPEVSIATYYILATAEASSNLARYDGIRYGERGDVPPPAALDEIYARSRSDGFGEEVKRRIMLGTFVLSAGYADRYYNVALRARRWITRRYAKAFEACDVILNATTPTVAFPFGDRPDPMSMYLCDVYTVDANIAGHCAMSVPGDATTGELPAGVHLSAAPFHEVQLFRAARLLVGDGPCRIAPGYG